MSNVLQLKPPAPKRPAAIARPLPADFQLTPQLRRWAADRGISRVDDRLEHFVDLALAKGYTYYDWSAAFRNACRTDWAKLGMPVPPTRCSRCKQPASSWTQRQDGRVCDQCDRQGQL